MNLKRLIQELKRRNVFKVAAVYAVAGWLVIQVATSVFPVLLLPSWLTRAVVILTLLGFPITIVIAWAFELTPEGMKRTDEAPDKTPILPQNSNKLNIILGTLLFLALAALSYQLFFKNKPAPSNSVTGHPFTDTLAVSAKSIAVLPFENLSTDTANAYFADGMQDMILTKLDQMGGLKVISRTSTEKYKSHPDNLSIIAKELHVATILEGSVQKAGNQVLVNVQLIDAHTDHHLWANDYTRTLNNVFHVEGDVAGKIARALKIKLAPSEKKKLSKSPTDNGNAFDLFLKANFQVDRYNNTVILPDSALNWYHQAIRFDTSFALAYANLANAERLWSRIRNADSLRNQALSHVRKALNINPNLATAHIYLGDIYELIDQNDKRAETEWETARQLSPNNADVLQRLAGVDVNKGRWDAVLSKVKRAIELDPKNSKRYLNLAYIEEDLKHYQKALQLFDQARQVNPADGQVFYNKTQILIGLGRQKQALKEWQLLKKASPALLALIGDYRLKYRIDGINRDFKQQLLDLQKEDSLAKEFRRKGQTGFGQAGSSELMNIIQYQIGKTYYYMGEHSQANNYFMHLLGKLTSSPPDKSPGDKNDRLALIAYCRAFLGQREKAIAAIKQVLQLNPVTDHYLNHYYYLEDMAAIYAHFAEANHAIPLLEQIFTAKGTGYITGTSLKNNPIWDPIRKDFRFQALIKQYAPQEQEI
jgi:TolB-like protein/Flp pilus assembly protein TadD